MSGIGMIAIAWAGVATIAAAFLWSWGQNLDRVLDAYRKASEEDAADESVRLVKVGHVAQQLAAMARELVELSGILDGMLEELDGDDDGAGTEEEEKGCGSRGSCSEDC